MATVRGLEPESSARDIDDELSEKWRSRALVDAPIAFRSIMRAVHEVGDSGSAQPDQKCADAILRGMVKGDVETASRLLAQVMETANHDDWWRDSFATRTYAYMKTYLGAFMEAINREAAKFGSDNRTWNDLLSEGLIADELRWRGAMAAVWVTPADGTGRIAGVTPAPPAGEPRFVVFQYCVSLGIVSLKRTSAVKVLMPGQSALIAGLPYSFLSLLLGWWGIPWGPFWTLETVARNLSGGIDVTHILSEGKGLRAVPNELDGRPDWMKQGRPATK